MTIPKLLPPHRSLPWNGVQRAQALILLWKMMGICSIFHRRHSSYQTITYINGHKRIKMLVIGHSKADVVTTSPCSCRGKLCSETRRKASGIGAWKLWQYQWQWRQWADRNSVDSARRRGFWVIGSVFLGMWNCCYTSWEECTGVGTVGIWP